MNSLVRKRLVVIGGGLGGLSVAALAARRGMDVTLLEKNDQCGGRATLFKTKGFEFDMGPSWYLMPEVFERYFGLFGQKIPYKLQLLDPSYRVFWNASTTYDLYPDMEKNKQLFEGFERDGGEKLAAYLKDARFKYKVSMEEFLYKEYRTIWDMITRRVITQGWRLHLLRSLHKHVKTYFQEPLAQKILEYSIVFLGGSPYNSPAMYSLISHVDLELGVWYPEGGINGVAKSIEQLGKQHGVRFQYSEPAQRIIIRNGVVKGVQTHKQFYETDHVVANADYHHVDTVLLPDKYRQFSDSYWNKRVMAPGAFIAYLGVNKKVRKLLHHNIFIHDRWDEHFHDIFNKPSWPKNPSYYVCCPSKTDSAVAPKGKENLFILVPIASGLRDTQKQREVFFDQTITHLEGATKQRIKEHIVVKRLFCTTDYREMYNAFKGSALSLAHTLGQTAIFRPPMRNKKAKGLLYCGQYTHPGIGVPMALIGAEVVDGILKGA